MKRSEIERLLPEVFRRALAADPEPGADTPLGALLDVMEALHRRTETVLGRVGNYFNPRLAGDRYLAMLSYWVNLDAISSTSLSGRNPLDWTQPATMLPPGRLRELITMAAHLSQWRGTIDGLSAFLETATGISGFRFDETVEGEDGLPVPFHVRIVAPSAAQPQQSLIERIIERERPVYITWELHFE